MQAHTNKYNLTRDHTYIVTWTTTDLANFDSSRMLYTHLESDTFPKRHITRHGEMIQLQHIRDAIKPLQKFFYLKQLRENAHVNHAAIV